jgi:putative oxygen-independent coproporphyrinogen III oxidase
VTADTAGLYAHIPFCLTRCGYCDFNTYAGLDHLKGGYTQALATEASLWAGDWRGTRFGSVFFGGGTPTMLAPETLTGLIGRFREVFDVVPEAEITSEANPDTLDEPYLATLLEGGVTRLSIGVQSFDPEVLRALDRVHSAEAARRAFRASRRAGFGNINLDLIYGANGESLPSWRRTVEEALSLGPEHLSCYALTIEASTQLGRTVATGSVPPPDPDLQADMYGLACNLLGAAGYEHYEVSNWARPGHRCLHNLGYWQGRPYLGLGAGAHSLRAGVRWWNVRPPAQYIATVSTGDRPIGGQEVLTEEDRRLERLLLGFRTSHGVPTEWVARERAEWLAAAGLADLDGGRITLTERGFFVASEVVLDVGD